MRKHALLVWAVVVSAISAVGQADLREYMLGDNDGFGIGTPLEPGDSIAEFMAALDSPDGSGTDERYVRSAP